ncbi:MAG: O-antigen ligase family protein [Betaproteobacteria bacterium]|nr:O-antigen ligase family protein [Betaproteobacteria bacterium]
MQPPSAPAHSHDRSGRLFQFETLALCAFAFVLPQFEVPKNILWIVYVLLWVLGRARTRDFGGPWDRWDSLIALWVASGYAAAMFAGLHDSEWKSAFDIARYGAVLWMMRRSGYAEGTLRLLLACIVFGTLAALLRGYYEVIFVPRADRQPRYLGLNSVGHVNHSAMYLAIVFGASVAWVRAAWQADPGSRRMLGLAVCAAFFVSIVVMQSRATVGASILVAIVFLAAYSLRSGKRAWGILAGAILLIAALFLAKPEVVEKNALRMKEHNMLAFRDNIWRTGIEAWRRYPAFGVGMGNYGRISHALLEQWSTERGESFDRSRAMPQAHAHNIFVNTLAERGAVGLLVLLAVLAAWIGSLRPVPNAGDGVVHWAYWGGALGAWLVAVGVGLVNTTLHHEHALVSVLLLGGWLSLARRPRPGSVERA